MREIRMNDKDRRSRMHAIGIFIQIDDKRFSDDEKLEAIRKVLKMSSFGMVHKEDMLAVIEWLTDLYEELKAETKVGTS